MYHEPQGNQLLSLGRENTDDWFPKHVTESAWLEHTPFAAWLIPALKPTLVVELGTHRAVSYMAFCQANANLAAPAQCYAVDTWEGDEHAGRYSEAIFHEVEKLNDQYRDFSTLLRCSFGEALSSFQDASIDLLHIDGLHTYEAVAQDFYSWLPKMSQRGIILFHDTEVRTRDFGVWRLWAEVSRRYPHFNFTHGFGLGVLVVGNEVPSQISEICARFTDPTFSEHFRRFFEERGRLVAEKYSEMSNPQPGQAWWIRHASRIKKHLRKLLPSPLRHQIAFLLRRVK
jgi:hypothetical protein